jgi:hypothetical protein
MAPTPPLWTARTSVCPRLLDSRWQEELAYTDCALNLEEKLVNIAHIPNE